MSKITAISVNTKPKRYVMSFTVRQDDKKVVVETTDNKNYAHDFDTMSNACNIIERIVNHTERSYTAEEVDVYDNGSANVFDEFVFPTAKSPMRYRKELN